MFVPSQPPPSPHPTEAGRTQDGTRPVLENRPHPAHYTLNLLPWGYSWPSVNSSCPRPSFVLRIKDTARVDEQ